MSRHYEAPVELRNLEKMITEFTYRNGFEISRVFDDWLEYMIGFFSVEGKPIEGWKYTKEQNLFFYKLMCEWIKVMDEQIKRKEWFDAFGDLYMACIASRSRQSGKGQFFTPPEVCDLMVMLEGFKSEKTGITNIDPTCGSGRLLLAWHVKNPGNYVFAGDIDRTCCMMTVCNFIIHGCVGEVICQNCFVPESYFGGWYVNRNLNSKYSLLNGIPHVEHLPAEHSKVIRYWRNRREEIEREKIAEEKNKPKQFNLFD